MGLTLSRMARRSLDAAGQSERAVIAVSRFTAPGQAEAFHAANIQTISSDLLAMVPSMRCPTLPISCIWRG